MRYRTVLCYTQIHETCQVGVWAECLLSLLPSSPVAVEPSAAETGLWHELLKKKKIAVPGVWEGKGISSFIVVCLFQIQGPYSVCRPCWLGMYCIAQTSLKLSHPPASASRGLELQAWATMPVFNDFNLHVSLCVCDLQRGNDTYCLR